MKFICVVTDIHSCVKLWQSCTGGGGGGGGGGVGTINMQLYKPYIVIQAN